MGFAQELKEFTSGFEKGWKLATPTDAELKDRDRRQTAAELKDAQDKGEAGVGSAGKPYVYGANEGATAGGGDSGGGVLPAFAQGDLMERAKRAIAAKESGGKYDIVGPTHAKYGRALGKYQVMESNVPSWTKEALGRSMTGDEFLADPKAQEKVFEHRFGGYLSKTGSVADAASMWHSGQPVARAGGRKDSLGTRTTDYAAGVARAVGGNPAPAGVLPVTRAPGGAPKVMPVAALDIEDEDQRYAPTQMVADGGRVLSREEVLREARAAAMGDPEVTGAIPSSGWTEPTVGAGEVARGIPAEDAPTIGAGASVQARSPEPRRAGVLPVTTRGNSQGLTGSPLPPERPRDNRLYDNGAALPGEGMTEDSDEPYDPQRMVYRPGIADAIEAGMNALGKAFGFSSDSAALPTARPDREANLRRFHANEGAATREEIATIDRTIDPQNKLSDDARAVARLYAGYKYFLSKGEPEKAANYSKSILQYTRLHLQTAGALAEDRIKAGDLAGGAKLIQEAHNQIPDGASLYVDKVDPATGKVDYRMVDEDGDLTERGQASANQLLQMATGMRNGSEWLAQIEGAKRGSLTAAQKLREKRRQKDEDALSEFQSGETDSDYLASLSPERKAAFLKMSPRVQNQVRSDWRREQDQKRARDRQEETYRQNDLRTERLDKQAEERTKKAEERQAKLDKDATDQQEFAAHVDAVRDAQEALNEQKRLDPEDTAKIKPLEEALAKAKGEASDWTKADKGRARYVSQLNRETRQGRASVESAGTQRASGGTAEERKVAALDQQYVSAQRAYERGEKTPEAAAKLQGLRNDLAFAKRDTGHSADTITELDAVLPKHLGVKEMDKVDPSQRLLYRNAVTGIMRGDNGVTTEDALALAELAAKTGKLKRTDDGRYVINSDDNGAGSPPLYISPEGVQAIAALRRAKYKPVTETVKNPFNQRTQRGMTTEQGEDAGDRASSLGRGNRRSTIRNAAEADRLKNELGSAYKDGMTLAQMRRALRDRNAADEFRSRSLPPAV